MNMIARAGEALYDFWDSLHDHHYDEDLGCVVTDNLNVNSIYLISLVVMTVVLAI